VLDVILKLSSKLFDVFSSIGERSEVDTRFDLVISRNTFKQRAIIYSVAIERHICIQSRVMTARQVVQNNDCHPAFQQQVDSYASDVAGPAGHKNRYSIFFTLKFSSQDKEVLVC